MHVVAHPLAPSLSQAEKTLVSVNSERMPSRNLKVTLSRTFISCLNHTTEDKAQKTKSRNKEVNLDIKHNFLSSYLHAALWSIRL